MSNSDLFAVQDLLERAIASGDEGLRRQAHARLAETDDRVRLHEPDGSVLIEIPGGDTWFARNERWVAVPPFRLGQHPVTNRQFAYFLEATGYAPDDDEDMGHFLAHWHGQRTPPAELLDHPVVHVSFVDALHYCRWAGLSLPSEWMWEKAAAGPEGQSYPWGEAPPRSGLAHIQTTHTAPVGSYRHVRTAYGCQDMLGNVSEWCLTTEDLEVDVLGPDAESFDIDAPHALEGIPMSVRGSAHMRRQINLMSCQHRRALAARRRNHWVGFRVAQRLADTMTEQERWGELRSVCHGQELDTAARLNALEYVLATWPDDEHARRRVAEYLRHHLADWCFTEAGVPLASVLEPWLNGRGYRVFEALHGRRSDRRPSYGMLARCTEQLQRNQPFGSLGFATFPHSERDAIVRWLENHGNRQPAPSALFANVRLPGAVMTLPALGIDQSTGKLSLYAAWRDAHTPWRTWTSRRVMALLEALVVLTAQLPAITVEFDTYWGRTSEMAYLWDIYRPWREG